MTRQPCVKQVRAKRLGNLVRHWANFLGRGRKAMHINHSKRRLLSSRTRPDNALGRLGPNVGKLQFTLRKPSWNIARQCIGFERNIPINWFLRCKGPDPRQECENHNN